MVRAGKVKLIYLRPLDLSVDETQQEIWDAIMAIGAKRVVIDSLSGFEMALAPTFRDDFRESMYRMMGTLTRGGVTLLMTVEVIESFSELRFSPHVISFLADDVLLQRYFEMNGELRRVMIIVKMRNSRHSTEFRSYDVTSRGFEMGESLRDLRGILTGVPEMQWEKRLLFVGLTDLEANVLQTLMDLGEADINQVAIKTGLKSKEVELALTRLVSLNYAVRGIKEDTFTFRSVARSLGQERYWKAKGAA
jgi:circadian clock protein KaiC